MNQKTQRQVDEERLRKIRNRRTAISHEKKKLYARTWELDKEVDEMVLVVLKWSLPKKIIFD